MLEEVADNPFLPKFYEDRKAYAFQTQVWFMLSRFRQLTRDIAQQDLFHRMTVSDYLFSKDRLFASINLDDDELSLYNQLVGSLEAQVPKPDVVVYLQASTDVLLKRIEKRGRTFEFNMDPGYLTLLNEAYNHFFFHYDKSPLLVINTDGIDFVADSGDLEEIVEQILKVRQGVTYYQPLRTRDKAVIKNRKGAP